MKQYYTFGRKYRPLFFLIGLTLLLGLSISGQAQVYYLTTSGNANVTTEADALNRVGYDGSNPTVLAPSVTGSPFLMALDAANQRVFIYESLATNRSIKVVGFNGTLIRTLSVAGNQLTALEYDPTSDNIYFLTSDNNAGTLSSVDALNRIKADGTEPSPQTLISSVTASPLLLALNLPSNEVYVYEGLAANRAIKTITLSGNGGSVTRTVAVGAQVSAIEYDRASNYIYYLTTDASVNISTTDALNRFRPDGSSNSVVSASITASPLLMALDQGNNRAFVYEGVTANRAIKAVRLSDGAVTQITSLALTCTALDVAPAPEVTTAAVTNVAGTSATAGGTVVRSALALTERGVVYSASNTAPTTSDSKTSNGSSIGTFPVTLIGLSSGATYSVRAYATSAAGTSYGSVQTFTTLSITAAPVLATPTSGTTINITQPTYGGTAPAGSTVTLYVDGNTIGTTTATGGNFSLIQPAALSPGGHSIYATAQLSGQTTSASSNTNSFTIDTSAPTVSITSSASNPTSSSPFSVTVTFSKAVTGFTNTDVNLTNATLTNFSGNGTTYSFNLTPTAPGTVAVNVAAGAAQDLAGNGNTIATTFSLVYALPNQAPSAISLSPGSGNENAPIGTLIGSFTTTDVDLPAQSFTYTLVSGTGSTDNASFTIGTTGPNLGKLLTNAVFDFETKASYSIRVRTTDSGSPALSFEQVFTVVVTNVNEAPTVATTLAPQSATVGQGFSFVIPANTFSDPETPNALSLAVSGLPAGLSFTGPATISGTPTTATGSPFSVTVTATDPGSLSMSTALTLTILAPTLTLSNLSINPGSTCVGNTVVISATVGNVTGSYSYSVTNGLSTLLTGSASSTTFSQSLVSSDSGIQTFTLTVSSGGQNATATTSLTVNTLPVATLTNDGPLSCTKSTVTLTASGGVNYQFGSGAAQVNAGNTATVTTSAPYSVTVTDASGCSASAITGVEINLQPPALSITPSSTTLSSANPSANLTANGTGTFRWSTGATTQAISVSTSGTYSVTLTTSGGCSATASATVADPEIIGGGDLTPTLSLPQANFTASGPESIQNLTMTLSEQAGKSTSGVIVLTLTAPLGYSLTFDPTQTSTNLTGGTTNPVPVNNANWEVRSSNLLQLTLVSKTGQRIGANGVSVIGLTLARVTASVGSANLTVNVNDDPTSGFDSNPANNIYVRILNALN